MQHLDEGTIHAWLDGALSPADAAVVEQHIAECAECSALAAEARGLIAGSARIISALDAVPNGVVPRASDTANHNTSLWRRLRLTPARASIAAALIVGVASTFVVNRERPVPVIAPTVSMPTTVATVRADSSPAIPQQKTQKPSPKRVTKSARAVDTVGPAPAPASVAVAAPAPSVPPSAAANSAAGAMATADVASRRSFMQNALTNPRPQSLEGCYQISPDSARVLPGLPARFALERDSLGRRVVRTLSLENKPDSVLDNVEWRQVAPNIASVFTMKEPQSQLTFTTSGAKITALAAGKSAEASVQRTACRP
jgi:hypothetical protein